MARKYFGTDGIRGRANAAITPRFDGRVIMVVIGLSTWSDATSKEHAHLSRRLLYRQWPGHFGATEEKNV